MHPPSRPPLKGFAQMLVEDGGERLNVQQVRACGIWPLNYRLTVGHSADVCQSLTFSGKCCGAKNHMCKT